MEEAESGNGREFADDSSPAERTFRSLRNTLRPSSLAHGRHVVRRGIPSHSLSVSGSKFCRQSLLPSLQS